jgi:type II secretory ATPase GspE/PulE/Tfp pilus assembly ATPase PilB-like protein
VTVEDPAVWLGGTTGSGARQDRRYVRDRTALILRQDPDVMLVGEILTPRRRGCDTGALTGHLVLSTLHTNDAPTALTRLLDLGVAPTSSPAPFEQLAQRPLRVICGHCKTPHDRGSGTLRELARARRGRDDMVPVQAAPIVAAPATTNASGTSC